MTTINRYSFWKRFRKHAGVIFVGISFLLFGVHDLAAGQSNTNVGDDSPLAQVISDHHESNKNLMSITFTNVNLEEALETLAERLRVGFSFNPDIMPDKRVNFSMTNVPAYEIIYKLLEGTNLEPVLPTSKDVIILKEKGSVSDFDIIQDTVSGTVVDSQTGESLMGVNVIVQGTTTGTTTDINGEYSLTVSGPETVLEYSYIGYVTQRVTVGEQTSINIELAQDIGLMDEVTVIGYGSVQKSDVTGAVSSISSEDFGDRQATSVSALIQGRAPGVDVSRGQIRIRGVTTFNDTDPLFVIDGFLGGDIATVNPNDIENIEVLKDASATAIYGSRGANGVILITTKSGETGPMKVDVNIWSGLKSTTDKRDVMNATQYVDYVHDALTNANQSIPDNLLTDDVRVDRNNWQDLVYQIGNTTEVNMSFSGGSESANYYMSLSHRADEEIRIGPSSDETYFRSKFDFTIKPWLDFGVNLASSYNINTGHQAPGLSAAIGYMPYKEIYDENQIGGYSDVHRINDASDRTNPLTATKIQPETNTLTYQTQGNIILKPFKGFTYTIQAGLQGNFNRFYQWNDEYVAAFNHVVNSMEESSSYFFSPIVESYINYTTEIGDHNISGLIGNSWQDGIKRGGIGIGATGYDTNEIQVIGVASTPEIPTQQVFQDSRLSYFGRLNYGYKSRYLMTVNMRADASPNFSPDNRWGKFPSLSVAWRISEESFLQDSNLINELKLRAGWGKSGNDSIGQYRYQASVFSQGVGYPLGDSQQYQSGATVVRRASPNIKWETTESMTLGLDYELFNNTFTGTIEYFVKQTNDILFAVPSPLSLGFGTGLDGGVIDGNAIVNAASVNNKGFEFLITKRGFLGKVNYNLSANYTNVKNEVTGLGAGQPFLSGVSRTQKGFPIGYFYGYVSDGIFETQAEIDEANALAQSEGFDYFQESSTSAGDVRYKDLNGDGQIDAADDRTNIGNPIPKHLFGLNLSLNYEQFDFNMFWQGAADLDLYDNAFRLNRAGTRISNQEVNVLDRWRSESQPGNGVQPRAVSGDAPGNTRSSTLLVQDASHIRLKLISLGYTFSDELTSKFGLTRLRIYASAENLLTFTGYDGSDPEFGGQNLVRGITSNQVPTPKTIAFGIQVGL